MSTSQPIQQQQQEIITAKKEEGPGRTTCMKCQHPLQEKRCEPCKKCEFTYCSICVMTSDKSTVEHFNMRKSISTNEMQLGQFYVIDSAGRKHRSPFRSFICGYCYVHALNDWLEAREEEAEEAEEEESSGSPETGSYESDGSSSNNDYPEELTDSDDSYDKDPEEEQDGEEGSEEEEAEGEEDEEETGSESGEEEDGEEEYSEYSEDSFVDSDSDATTSSDK